MSAVVTIINRLPAGESAFRYALNVSHRLRANGLACVAVQSRRPIGNDLPIHSIGNPEVGPPIECLPPACGDGGSCISDLDIQQFFQQCKSEALAADVPCDLQSRRSTFGDVIEACHTFFGLVCLSRESLFDGETPCHHLSKVLSWTPRPLLICPSGYRPWRRIIVAASSRHDLVHLTRWSGHWSRSWNLPCEVVPPRTNGPVATSFGNRCRALYEEWLPGLAMSRAKWHECAADWNFDESDLLLVGRDATLWPLPFGDGIRLQTLARVFPGTLGILPSLFVGSVTDLLSSADGHGTLTEDSVLRVRVA